MVLFGGSGDLARRKLLPALLNLYKDGLLPDEFAVVAIGRQKFTDEAYRQQFAKDVPAKDAEAWRWLEPRLGYHIGDIGDPASFVGLRDRLAACDKQWHTAGNVLFYLALAPTLFGEAVRQLGRAKLTREDNGWRRVVIEKPFGHSTKSARDLNQELLAELTEQQIYRIDHYLGKETVQNIMVLRFANGIFEPIWNRRYIDHVQITVAESLGVEGRGGYYDTSGALRDMVPNHLVQLLSLIAMEPPSSLDADPIRAEQEKVLRSIAPLSGSNQSDYVRGQYGPGAIDGKPVPGYRAEKNVAPNSTTETFAALKLNVGNWRWADVPFYLRTGKRLSRRRTEIVIQFRRAPHLLFSKTAITHCTANQLVLGIQPEERLSLRIGAKVPGPTVRLGAVAMDFDYLHTFGENPSTGYERLLHDCMIGDQTLYKREDMIELGWQIVDSILDAWQSSGDRGLEPYPAGSNGPPAATQLIERDGRHWREDSGCS
jgi:glucose-6-phosphate 1-dehydrogenase